MDQTLDCLKRACRALPDRGTAFFVSGRHLLTCAHALPDGTRPGSRIPLARPLGEPHDAEVLEVVPNPQDDVALLRVDEGQASPTWARLGTRWQIGDAVFAYGFPVEYRAQCGDGLTGTLESETTAPLPGRGTERIKFKDCRVIGGFSGGPLLHCPTGEVIGIVAETRDKHAVVGGWAIPVARLPTLLKGWPDVEALGRCRAPVARCPLPGPIPWEAEFRRLLVHFLDHHVLSFAGRDCLACHRDVARHAFRVAAIICDQLVIPAVSYAQCSLCRALVDEHADLHRLGILGLVGDADCWPEMVATRRAEYWRWSPVRGMYGALLTSDVPLPRVWRHRSRAPCRPGSWLPR